MTKKLFAQAIDFQQIIQNAFPAYTPGKIDITNPNLTIGDIISRFLPYVFLIAGLILFGVLIIGGFELLFSGGEPEKVKSGQGKLTSALVGFLIIFIAYWLAQILEIIFGIKIL